MQNTEIIIAGDFNAFDCQKENTSKVLRQNDFRISRFKKLSEVLEKRCFLDFALFSVIYSLHFLISDCSFYLEWTTLLEVQPSLITYKCIEILTRTITLYTSVHQLIDLKGAKVTANSLKVSFSSITSFFLNISYHLTFSLMISYLSMNSKSCSCVCCPLIKEELNSRAKRGLTTLNMSFKKSSKMVINF